MQIDPMLPVAAFVLLAAVAGGPLVVRALERLPEKWRTRAVWALLVGVAVVYLAADLLTERRLDGVVLLPLLVFPGVFAYLAFRTMLASMVVTFAPLYFVITAMTAGRATNVPEIALDRAMELKPAWMLVYGSLYVFVIVMPVMIVRQRDLLRRTMQAYLAVMLVAYAGFLLYPTAAPRPAFVPGDGFSAWTLRVAYDIDPPYGCFPSLHVAYAFAAALACYRVHRKVGIAAAFWAAMIGVSTVYTKQHYVVDAVVGALMGLTAYALFLRTYPRDSVAPDDHRLAPRRAAVVIGLYALMVAGFGIAYFAGR